MILTDIVHITADNTNVYSGRLGSKVPSWARRVRFQLTASDQDWTFDCSIGGEELARDSGPHLTAAANSQRGDWTAPHIQMDIPRPAPTDFDVLVDVNVVTAGEGLAIIQWES